MMRCRKGVPNLWQVSCLLLVCVCITEASECDAPREWNQLEARIEALEKLVSNSLPVDDSDQTTARSHGLFPRNSTDHAGRFIVAQEQRSWHTYSRFVVAVDGLPRVTAAYMQSETNVAGSPHHFVLGGINGMLHVHSLTGRMMLEYETEGASPITAIIEKRRRANSTHVVTGHADGCVRWHIMDYSLSARSPQNSSIRQVQNNSYCPDAQQASSADAAIKLLSIGRVYHQQQKLTVVAVTERDDVVTLRDGGRPPVITPSPHRVHHVYFENKQVRLMTEHGFSHGTLHSTNNTVKAMTCRDLNSTTLVAAALDPSLKTRAFGVSAAGELVSLSLPGDKRVMSCRLRYRSPAFAAVPEGVSVGQLHDAVLVADSRQLWVFNSSTRVGDWQVPIIQEDISTLVRRIGVQGRSTLNSAPVMSGTDSYVLLQVTDSIVALYHRPSREVGGSMSIDWFKWSRPLMLLGALVFGAFQFSKKRASRFPSSIDHAAEMRMRSKMLERARMARS